MAEKYVPPNRRKSESNNSNAMTVKMEPSTCSTEVWIWARNRTTFNNFANTENVGKWLIFPKHEDVDDTWAKIALNTEQGNLGSIAKVSTIKDRTGIILTNLNSLK